MRVGEAVTGGGFTGRSDHEVVRVREEAADLRTETTAFCVHPNGFDRGSTNVRIRRSDALTEDRESGLSWRMRERHKRSPALRRRATYKAR